MCNEVELHDRVGRDVGRLVLEATVHVDCLVVVRPDGVTESLNGVELLPFGVLSLVYFHQHILADRVGSTAENDHERTDEDGRVLVACKRLFSIVLVRSLDPVPAAVTVSAQAPGIFEGTLVGGPPAKNDHHASSATHMAHGS